MKLASNRVLLATARILHVAVALVFILAATMKALDPQSFIEQIATYGIFPDLSWLAAWVLIIVEFMLSFALIVNFWPRLTPLLMSALLLFFIGITAYGMSIGLGENCGCFGNLVHRGPETVIIEDAVMLLAMLFALLVYWHKPVPGQNWRAVVTVAGGALAVLLVVFSARIPADDLVTQLRPGAQFSTWPIDGLYGTDLNSGTHVVFLFTVHSDDLQRDVNRMNSIAQHPAAVGPVGLVIDGTQHLTSLMFEYAAAFPIGAIEPRFARPLYRTLPRVFILHNGMVTHTWSELPDAADVVSAIQSISKETQRK